MRRGFDVSGRRMGRAAVVVVALFIAGLGWAGAVKASSYKVIHDFCARANCFDGYGPQAPLIMDADGDLYGVTYSGGSYYAGTAFELVPNADKSQWTYKLLYSFCAKNPPDCKDGVGPFGPLVIDTAGNLYGVTIAGSYYHQGIAYELVQDGDRTKRKLTTLYVFGKDASDARQPTGLAYPGAAQGLPYDGVSPLYGISVGDGNGTAFTLTPNGSSTTESVIYRFCSQADCTDGRGPNPDLLFDGSGNIFGTTYLGGADNNHAVAFELVDNAGTWSETVLHTFCMLKNCSDGATPAAGFVADDSGNLFGTAALGGNQRKGCCGAVFELVPNGAQSQYDVVYNFCSVNGCRDGANPVSAMIRDASGNLYGATQHGGGNDDGDDSFGAGTIFAMTGSSLTILHRFCAKANCVDGKIPQGGVIRDGEGRLFGTATGGGRFDGGVVFELTP